MVLAALAGIYYLINTAKLVSLIIAFQVLSIILTLCPDKYIHGAGVILYIVTVLSVFIYSTKDVGYDSEIKLHFAFITIPVIIINIFVFFKLPYAGVLGLTMIVPLLSMMVLYSTKKRELKKDIGMLVIIAVDALIRFLLTIEWMTEHQVG
jgi:hypothetical protein